MIDQVNKAIQQIEKLPREKQLEIAQLIQDELSWDNTFDKTRDKLEMLTKEAIKITTKEKHPGRISKLNEFCIK